MYLSCLNQFVNEVHCMVAVIKLTHHLGYSFRTYSIICTTETKT